MASQASNPGIQIIDGNKEDIGFFVCLHLLSIPCGNTEQTQQEIQHLDYLIRHSGNLYVFEFKLRFFIFITRI